MKFRNEVSVCNKSLFAFLIKKKLAVCFALCLIMVISQAK